MKILFVDTAVGGHHIPYFKAVTVNAEYESAICIPKKVGELSTRQIEVKNIKIRSAIQYLNWIKELSAIAKLEGPDIIHFLYGDVFYRYFGLALSRFSEYKTVVTFHQINKSFLRDISIKAIFNQINMGIVHTKFLSTQLNNIGIKNVKQIEHPIFFNFENITKEYAITNLGLESNVPVLLAIGGTRYDKGLDILLEALKYVQKPFQLLIAGKELHFDRNFIEKNIESYKHNVKLLMRFLSDEEFYMCIKAADIIVLPYRKTFTGVSGHLGQAAWLKKTIIAPNHGSLGRLISDNRIGVTFKTEDVSDLAKVINEKLENKHEWNDTAENYRLTLSSDKFADEHQKLYFNINI